MLPMTKRSAPLPRCLLISTTLALCLLPALSAADEPFVVDQHYRLQAGDVIIISVLGEESLSGSRQIGPGGSIALPLVGSVPVVGQSLLEVTNLVTKYYKDVLRRPLVTVSLDETASKRRVYVTGRVEKPGSQMLPLGSTLPEAVVAAGFSEDSDLSHVTLRRAGGQFSTVDLSGLRTSQPLETNIVLQWDDRVFVPERDMRLIVLGQIAKPGSYNVPLGRRLTLLELITQIAGGLTSQAAKVANLIRGDADQTEQIDLTKLLEQGDLSQNRDLRPGDTVVIPESGRVTIAGEVSQPTTLFPTNNMTLLEAMVRVGGFTPNAGLRKVQVRRDDHVSVINFEDVWRRGNLTDNLVLQAGDVVIVPKAAAEEVLITGAVARAGTIDIRDQDSPTLLKLLSSAGKAPNGDYTRVSIYRENEHVVANAQAAMEQGDMRGNPLLLPGDVVYVPEVGKVAMLGAFSRPGLVDYDPKLTFMQYLSQAGLPPAGTARLDKGVVIRTRPDGTYETVQFDVSKIIKGQIPDPIKILPGDIIYIEGKGPARADLWTQIRDILFTFGAIRGLIP